MTMVKLTHIKDIFRLRSITKLYGFIATSYHSQPKMNFPHLDQHIITDIGYFKPQPSIRSRMFKRNRSHYEDIHKFIGYHDVIQDTDKFIGY